MERLADGIARAERGSAGTAEVDRVPGWAAEFLRRRGLQWPVLLLLDLASPFRLLIQQALWVAHPALSPWLGDRLLLWASQLDDGEALERARRLFQ